MRVSVSAKTAHLYEMKAVIVNEFSGPFKSHDVCQLARREEAIKFPLVKRDPLREASATLQTPAEVDLRSKSDCVCSLNRGLFIDKYPISPAKL